MTTYNLDRDNTYLESRLEHIWANHFPDVKRINRVQIKFGRRCFKRLGTIRRANVTAKGFDTLILLNGHFRSSLIPSYIIDATIAHELAHYAHGIASPLPRLHKYPHRGGIIDQELTMRGIQPIVETEAKWLTANWRALHGRSVRYQNAAEQLAYPAAILAR